MVNKTYRDALGRVLKAGDQVAHAATHGRNGGARVVPGVVADGKTPGTLVVKVTGPVGKYCTSTYAINDRTILLAPLEASDGK